MFGGGLTLALAPAPLILGTAVLYGLPAGARRWARVIGSVAAAAALALLALQAIVVSGGGRVEIVYLTPLSGIDLLTRADPLGITLALAAASIAVLALAERDREPVEAAALLVTASGAIVAVVAGNAIVLFAGMELANLGTALALSAGRRRPGRGATAGLAVQHLGALGVLASAALLQTRSGTTDFIALPPGAVTAAAGIPWALGGAIRLLAPASMPMRAPSGSCTQLAALGALPAGSACLLRLHEAAGGSLPNAVVWILGSLGALVVLAAGVAALRSRGDPALAGRAVVVMTGAGAVALSGVSGAPASGAVAAGVCAVILAAALAPAWEQPARSRSGAWVGAVSLLAAGGLPFGVGSVAVVLEVAAALSLGRAGSALGACLAGGWLLAVAASVRAVLSRPSAAGGGSHPLSAVATAALAASLFGALLPGALASIVIPALGGGGVGAVDAAALATPEGGWASGYLLVALLLGLVGWLAVAGLQGSGLALASSPAPAGRSSPGWTRALRLGRVAHRPLHAGAARAASIDGWLMFQPQLPLLLIGGVLAIVLVH